MESFIIFELFRNNDVIFKKFNTKKNVLKINGNFLNRFWTRITITIGTYNVDRFCFAKVQFKSENKELNTKKLYTVLTKTKNYVIFNFDRHQLKEIFSIPHICTIKMSAF